MKLKLSTKQDIDAIMSIIKDAQNYLANLGIDQWQDGYPNEEQIQLDISNKDSYVIVDDMERVMATTVFTTKEEPTYQTIEGNWKTKGTVLYGVIHRLAVSDNFRSCGIANFVFEECEARLKKMNADSLRIDTHRQNKGMQYLMDKMGYAYCGIIYVTNGDERLAYEKLLQ